MNKNRFIINKCSPQLRSNKKSISLIKKTVFASIVLLSSSITLQAQQGAIYPKDLVNQSGDHFVIQLGGLAWMNNPDSIRTKFSSRSFNAYFMWNIPFKTNPKFSVSIGAGVGSDNMFFDKIQPDVKGGTPTLRFIDKRNTDHFKKFKLVTTYLEAPVELRFTSNTNSIHKAIKIAIGAKVGLLLNAHTKGKTVETASGETINSYTEKTTSSRYFNGTRFSGTFRIGYGVFSVFTTYQLSPFFKTGAGPDVKPFTIGLTLSGL